ncbi:MAG: serine hydrolase [Candidatus Eremiobacteraeota bacterium]|nr:serine hydrolase [Candidatus Eremiobacteraeota bacterium]
MAASGAHGNAPVWYAARVDGATHLESGADTVLPAASVIKLLIALALVEEAHAGRFNLTSRVSLAAQDQVGGSDRFGAASPGSYPAAALLDAMLSVSDNTASNALLRAVGMSRCNQVAAAHGLRSTRIRRRFYDWAAQRRGLENETTAREAAQLLLLIAGEARQRSGAVVARRAMSALLAQTDRETIPAALPNRTGIANKTGELPGVRNDVAIVGYGHSDAYVVAVLDRYASGNRTGAVAAIRDVVRMVDRRLRRGLSR